MSAIPDIIDEHSVKDVLMQLPEIKLKLKAVWSDEFDQYLQSQYRIKTDAVLLEVLTNVFR